MATRKPPVRRKRLDDAGVAPAQRPGPDGKRRVYLHRSVAVFTPSRVEIRPALSAAIVPLFAFLVGACAFAFVLASATGAGFPLWLTVLALVVAVIMLPIAGMGVVYSVIGASVVVDANKRSATWQQGLLGLGVGTRELVPFEKIAAIVIDSVSRNDADVRERRVDPVQQWDLVLEKTSGRRLTIGTVSVLRPLRREGYDRIREVAAEVARLTGAPLGVPTES